jgi:hypothetical protein
MLTLLALLGCLIGFAPTSVLLARRGYTHFVLLPFLAAWAAAFVVVANYSRNESGSGSWYGDTESLLCLGLWLASPLLGAAWVTNQFEPVDGVGNTILGATIAALGGLLIGTIFVLIMCSPSL